MTKEERQAYSRAYYQANKERVRRYYQLHRAEKLQYQRNYHASHPKPTKPRKTVEQHKQRQATYRAARKAEISAYFKIWYQKNKEALSQRRREKRLARKQSQ